VPGLLLFKKGPQYRCLAQSHLSDDRYKSLSVFNSIDKGGDRFFVARTEVKKARVWGNVKRFLGKSEVLKIHKKLTRRVRRWFLSRPGSS
jgi:hypothetical protein